MHISIAKLVYSFQGENCSYSHDAADSKRKPELCKFYQQGYCKKGLQCPLLHGEYPCKAFHKGECSKDPCTFSHLPLTSFTQPIFDQVNVSKIFNIFNEEYYLQELINSPQSFTFNYFDSGQKVGIL